MIVRHLVAAENVRDGRILDLRLVRHGTIGSRLVSALAGPVDPATHLNLDFDDHRLDGAIVVEELRLGARVVDDGAGGFAWAEVADGAFERLGPVDVGTRRGEWQRKFAALTRGARSARYGRSASESLRLG